MLSFAANVDKVFMVGNHDNEFNEMFKLKLASFADRVFMDFLHRENTLSAT